MKDPLTTHEVNLTGTLNLLWAAKTNRVKGFVFASSSSVYGEAKTQRSGQSNKPKKETQPPAPLSPYAVSKVGAEVYCRIFYKLYGLPTVSLRYFNVFGPRQDPHSQYAAVIPKFITALLAGHAPVIYGDGKQSRDFTYVENVVRANLLAIQSLPAFGMAVNIGCGKSYNLLQLVEALAKITGKKIAPAFDRPRPGDIRHSMADISRAKRLLGFKPAVEFAGGLATTVDFFSKSA